MSTFNHPNTAGSTLIVISSIYESWVSYDLNEHALKALAAMIASDLYRYQNPTKSKAKVLAVLNLMRVHGINMVELEGGSHTFSIG